MSDEPEVQALVKRLRREPRGSGNAGYANLRRKCHEAADLIEKLENWVNDLQSGMYINCVYCGHRYGGDRREHRAKAAASRNCALSPHVPAGRTMPLRSVGFTGRG